MNLKTAGQILAQDTGGCSTFHHSSLRMRLMAILGLSAMAAGCQSIPSRSAADRAGIDGAATIEPADATEEKFDSGSRRRTSRSVMFLSPADAETHESLKKAYDEAGPAWRAEALVKLYNFERAHKTFDFTPMNRREKTIAFTIVSAVVVGSLMMFMNSKSKKPHYPPWPAYCPPVDFDGHTYTCDSP